MKRKSDKKQKKKHIYRWVHAYAHTVP